MADEEVGTQMKNLEQQIFNMELQKVFDKFKGTVSIETMQQIFNLVATDVADSRFTSHPFYECIVELKKLWIGRGFSPYNIAAVLKKWGRVG